MNELPELCRQPKMLIDGRWRSGSGDREESVVNPASAEAIARYRIPSAADLDEALESAARGFRVWRQTPAFSRGKVLRRAAALLRERSEQIANVLTMEEGKPLAEARGELLVTIEMFEWFAEEGLRAYGRMIPARAAQLQQTVVREPVGPTAAFAAWNFPARNPGYKIAAALAAGCSCVAKPAEETPLTCLLLAQALLDAGLPAGVLNVVYGDAAAISQHLIASPVIRKISFTGSTRVGKLLAKQAADTVKKVTLELGGHAPVIICDDADIELAVQLTATAKFRNAGQVCIAPTRFYVHEARYRAFVARFAAFAGSLAVGNGLDSGTAMGPLFHQRRTPEMERFVADARARHADIVCGGNALARPGYFWTPTVIADLADDTRLMNEEPFGPIAGIVPFSNLDDVIERANGLPYGLAAYAFTRSLHAAHELGARLECGMLGINTCKVSYAETPFGGVKESGYGSEGAMEGLDAFLVSKLISMAY